MTPNKKVDLIIFNYNFIPEDLRTYVFKSDEVPQCILGCLEHLNRIGINSDQIDDEKWGAWEQLDAACLADSERYAEASELGYRVLDDFTFNKVKGILLPFLKYSSDTNDWKAQGKDTATDTMPYYCYKPLPGEVINSVRIFEVFYIM